MHISSFFIVVSCLLSFSTLWNRSFFLKGPDNKYFRCCRPILSAEEEKQPQTILKTTGLCSNETLFTKNRGGGQIWPQWADPSVTM